MSWIWCMTATTKANVCLWDQVMVRKIWLVYIAHLLQLSPQNKVHKVYLHNDRQTSKKQPQTWQAVNDCHTPTPTLQMTASSLWANLKKQPCRTYLLFCSCGCTCINYECEQIKLVWSSWKTFATSSKSVCWWWGFSLTCTSGKQCRCVITVV